MLEIVGLFEIIGSDMDHSDIFTQIEHMFVSLYNEEDL